MLQYASATGLMRTILIILLIWFGGKILLRLFAPFIMQFFVKKAEEKFGSQFNPNQQKRQQAPPEGEVVIDKIPKQETSNKNVGEYVDYEEID
ncbi:DUF4834 family protein [Formosa sp. PL04]|uniref:DUF4834 family protein n=1 Tax=Formosa sp. PL04 TaxID=3081755 RepID=UPI002981437C|nr:DUF4834 family protein [Formosa sp. PL04]MDW5288368.1 DUF4834 family protein [Formosa sp. PL04]